MEDPLQKRETLALAISSKMGLVQIGTENPLSNCITMTVLYYTMRVEEYTNYM